MLFLEVSTGGENYHFKSRSLSFLFYQLYFRPTFASVIKNPPENTGGFLVK